MVLEQRRKDAEDAQRQSDEGRDFLAEGQSRTHSQQLYQTATRVGPAYSQRSWRYLD